VPEKYYLDACIWIDYFENRSDRLRPLGDWAFSLIKKIIDENGLIIFSDLVFEELCALYSQEAIVSMLSICPEDTLIRITASYRQINEAKVLSRKLRTPLKDTLHAVLARDNDAILITRDKHFTELFGKVSKPEELI
jgi:predicted nucleic acid-binding protein